MGLSLMRKETVNKTKSKSLRMVMSATGCGWGGGQERGMERLVGKPGGGDTGQTWIKGGSRAPRSGEDRVRQGNSKCKGPGVSTSLTRLRHRLFSLVVRVQGVWGSR